MSGFDKESMNTTNLKEITGLTGIKGARKENNMYFIPVGSTLYRGDSHFTDIDDNELLTGDFKFFTPDQNYADKYGIVFEFETTTNLNLLAMDDISEQFYNDAPEYIQTILTKNYGYESKERDSVPEEDNKLSEYICNKPGYQGYAANTMKSVGFADDLNAELVICSPKNHMKPIKRITKEDKIWSKQDELRMRKVEHNRVQPRKKPRREVNPPSMGVLNFGDDDDEDEVPFVSHRLSGGKTKKTKKSKKQSKKKKAKTQRKRKSNKSKKSKKSKTNKK